MSPHEYHPYRRTNIFIDGNDFLIRIRHKRDNDVCPYNVHYNFFSMNNMTIDEILNN